MKLKDISAGPDWVVWIAFIVFAVFSIVLLLGVEAGLFPDTILLPKKKRQNITRKNYAE